MPQSQQSQPNPMQDIQHPSDPGIFSERYNSLTGFIDQFFVIYQSYIL